MERRRPQMPNQLAPFIEQGIALGNPGLGLRRVSAQLARPDWAGSWSAPAVRYSGLRRHLDD